MEKVLNQAEMLGEAILESEEYIAMRLSEQAAMRDEAATQLIASYTEKRTKVENLLADANMDPGELARAGAELQKIEEEIDANEALNKMRQTRDTFNEMMKNVNAIIKFVVTGEKEEEEACTGSCSTCSGCGHHHHH
ncbi:MAG: YlbF family regulator [Clostridiales bacterium]|nr:YlbF family regulator [Clostridiales bacterium]